MPISSIGTVVPTMQEFNTHWIAVNDVGLPDLTLFGGFTQAAFATMITTVDAAITDTIAKDNLQTNLSGQRDISRIALRERLRQFRAALKAQVPGARYKVSVPNLPQNSSATYVFLKAFDDMSTLWTAVNANVPAVVGFTPPLLLAGQYPVATFNTDLATLRTTFGDWEAAIQNAEQSRAIRDDLFAQAQQRMLQYQSGVVQFLPTGHPLLSTIPVLSPLPGSTPPAPNLSGSWNSGTSLGNLVWLHPDVSVVDHWEVRYHPGPVYKASEEQAVPGGNIAVGTMNFATAYGLAAVGSIAWFKVYAMTSTGNEKGSNAVKIVRA